MGTVGPGARGFSPLISEAVDLLLTREEQEDVEQALSLEGILDDDDAEGLEGHVRDLRSRPGRGSADGEGDWVA